MLSLDVQRGTTQKEYSLYRASPTRRGARAHISTESKTALPWSNIVTTHPISDWKAFYTQKDIQEVGLELQMLAWDLPAVVLVTKGTRSPFYHRDFLSQGIQQPTTFFPPAFPARLSLPEAGRDTVFLGLDVYPTGHQSPRPWMRSTIARTRQTSHSDHSTFLAIDPIGQKSLELRTTHHNKQLDQTVQIVINGHPTSYTKDDLLFGTRIKVTKNGTAVQYTFNNDGNLLTVQNALGQTIPVENASAFAELALGLDTAKINHAQTIRSLWVNAGRTTPYNPLHNLVTQKTQMPVPVEVQQPLQRE